jgi:hypothetical protein
MFGKVVTASEAKESHGEELKLRDCFVVLLRLGRARRGLAMTDEKTFYLFINNQLKKE